MHKNRTTFLCCMRNSSNLEIGYGTTSQKCRVTHPVVCRSQKWSKIFKATNLLIAKFPRLTSHTSNTVDNLNKSRSTGLVNIFMLVLPLVHWWWCCCCLFLWQWTTVSSTMGAAVVVVAAWWQRQWGWWWRWTTIGGKSGRQQEHQRSHDGMQ